MPVINPFGTISPNHASVATLKNVVLDICRVVTDYTALAVAPNLSLKFSVAALLRQPGRGTDCFRALFRPRRTSAMLPTPAIEIFQFSRWAPSDPGRSPLIAA